MVWPGNPICKILPNRNQSTICKDICLWIIIVALFVERELEKAWLSTNMKIINQNLSIQWTVRLSWKRIASVSNGVWKGIDRVLCIASLLKCDLSPSSTGIIWELVWKYRILSSFFFFFLMWTIDHFKFLLNLLQYCFFKRVLGCEVCGILAPQPGIEPTSSALKGEVLTTGLPGKSLVPILDLLNWNLHFNKILYRNTSV